MAQTIEALFLREKELRQADEVNAIECEQVLREIIRYYKANNDYVVMQEMLQALAKRRRQSKQAIAGMVREAMSYLDELPPKHDLLFTLRSVTEGKIYLEVEFARLTKRLAGIHEVDGQVQEASNLLQEVQVETYGSMEKDEKLEYLLEQLRLLLELKDFVRFHIISKKVNRKILDEEQFLQQKIRFLKYLILYFDHEENYLEVALAYKTIYESSQNVEALQNMVTSLLLVQYNAEQIDLLRRFQENESLHPAVKQTTDIILGNEIGRLPMDISDLIPDTQKYKLLIRRVNQHNIRIVQKYYTQITLRRMSELLELSIDDTEQELRDMVSYMGFGAKINRPEGYVKFARPDAVHDKLNFWGDDIHNLLVKLEEVNHLVNREHIVFNQI